MTKQALPEGQRKEAKGGKLVPALCNIVGTLILLSVIGVCLLMAAPRMMDFEIYNIVSGSMEPEIPIGSVIYVEPAEPETVQTGDVIAFWSGDSVIAHRVVENQTVEGKFTTKGDANAGEDMNDVEYDALIGRVSRHYPYLGAYLEILTSNVGKLYIIGFAACGAMLNVLAGRIRERRRNRT